MRKILILTLLAVVNTVCFSQTEAVSYHTTNVYVEKGNYYFDKKEYKKALVYYNMSLRRDNNYYAILRKAETYAKMGLYDHAAECYRIFFGSNQQVSNDNRLKYAFLLLKNKNIKGFERWIKEYIANVESEEYSKDLYKDTSFVIVENENTLNTQQSEMSPVVYQDKIIFTSTRKNLDGSKENKDYNVFSAEFTKTGRLGRLNTYNKNLNSKENESSVYFSGQSGKMYFTRNAASNQGFKTYTGNIPSSQKDNFPVTEFTIDGFDNIGHVAFNSNGTKIYFVSDAPGGLGGLDIYTADLVNGTWSNPKNLGKRVNSEKDETYPFVLNDTTLYFTSDKPGGLGGYDLYSLSLKDEFSSAKNMGSEVNSRYDDFCLSFAPNGFTGYFCSNRRGGFGQEDIYRLHLLNLKIKYEPFKFKQTPSIEDQKINLYLSDGQEYNIASEDGSGFHFGFHPQEDYKMVIQHENPLANNIINNNELTGEEKEKAFLLPKPFDKTVIDLQPGIKYMFTAGMKRISDEYKKELEEVSKEYQGDKGSTIDLTILAKELFLTEDEIYTIHFVKANKQSSDDKAATTLSLNNQNVDLQGRSFFILLPLDIQANFNIETDLTHFTEAYKPKKTGPVKIDAAPVMEQKPVIDFEGFPILVNTEVFEDAGKMILAKELAIIPGSLYNFSLTKTFPGTDEKLEIFVPLTKGVKYNLGSEAMSASDYDQALSQMETGETGVQTDEELIDISVLSKELDISPGDSILFTLLPVKNFKSASANVNNVITVLDVDGRKYFITRNQKMQVKLRLDQHQKMNLQTDLKYIQENFDPRTITLTVDNESLARDLAEMEKFIITDPVYDIIVVNFDINKYNIRPDGEKILDKEVIQEMKNDKRLYVTIKGYTDPLGDAEYNKKLSENRAQSVKDYLAANGIGEERIRTFSFGETLSLQEGEYWEELSEEELKKHRKVEIKMYLPR